MRATGTGAPPPPCPQSRTTPHWSHSPYPSWEVAAAGPPAVGEQASCRGERPQADARSGPGAPERPEEPTLSGRGRRGEPEERGEEPKPWRRGGPTGGASEVGRA